MSSSDVQCKVIDLKQKALMASIPALGFLLVGNPEAYKLTNKLLGGKILSQYGCPTTMGVVIHAAVFFALMLLLTQPWQTKTVLSVKGKQPCTTPVTARR